MGLNLLNHCLSSVSTLSLHTLLYDIHQQEAKDIERLDPSGHDLALEFCLNAHWGSSSG
jgi:hypothetical protein